MTSIQHPSSHDSLPTAPERLAEERLPFTVRIVDDPDTLDKAVRLRRAAYGRHVPELANRLAEPEEHDLSPGCAVLIAESKLDGEPLGTMRIQTNEYGPLWLEQSVRLPDWLRGCRMAEATRLGMSTGAIGRQAKAAIFKAYFVHCLAQGIEYLVIAGRSPLDRQYEALLFVDVFPGRGFIPMSHAGNIPHRVLTFEVATAEARWREANHPLYNFVFRTFHPDIAIHMNARTVGRAPTPLAEEAYRYTS